MDEWPAQKKRHVFEIVRALPLPETGAALDFGCGNGIFADILRQALPSGWSVWGADISETAITNARRRHPACRFHALGHPELARRTFDLVFTRHVLEHVLSLPDALDVLDAFLHDGSTVLHILPCGNAGSFEHAICRLRADGIDAQREHRFFFEDPAHVRRLTTDELVAFCDAHGLRLTSESCANQRDGAIDWITRTNPRFLRHRLERRTRTPGAR